METIMELKRRLVRRTAPALTLPTQAVANRRICGSPDDAALADALQQGPIAGAVKPCLTL